MLDQMNIPKWVFREISVYSCLLHMIIFNYISFYYATIFMQTVFKDKINVT